MNEETAKPKGKGKLKLWGKLDEKFPGGFWGFVIAFSAFIVALVTLIIQIRKDKPYPGIIETECIVTDTVFTGRVKLSGNIRNTGSHPEYLQYGILIGTTPGLTIDQNNKVKNTYGLETGIFSLYTDLDDPGVRYYYRTYLANPKWKKEAGTVYGEECSFFYAKAADPPAEPTTGNVTRPNLKPGDANKATLPDTLTTLPQELKVIDVPGIGHSINDYSGSYQEALKNAGETVGLLYPDSLIMGVHKVVVDTTYHEQSIFSDRQGYNTRLTVYYLIKKWSK